MLNNFHYRKGGSEAVYFNTAELLQKHGHQVEFYSLRRGENYSSTYEDKFALSSKEFNNMFKAASKYINNKDAAEGLEKVIQDFKPDIAHIHLIWGGLTGAVLRILKKYKIPVVHTAHDYRMVCPAYTFRTPSGKICEACHGHNFFNVIYNRCAKGSLSKSVLMAIESYIRNIRKTYEYFDYVIYVSKFCRDIHIKYNDVLRNIPNSVLYNFVPEPDIKKAFTKELYTFFGRLSGEKGIYTLINAFKKKSSLKLQVIGTGPLEKDLNEYVKVHKIRNVTFLGYKTGIELRELVAESKFVCIPSEWYENNPMSALEAFSMGVPVISADIGGCPEIVIPGKTGFLFESGNVDSLCEVLEKTESLSKSEYSALSKYAIDTYKENSDSEAYYNKLIRIYECLLKKDL